MANPLGAFKDLKPWQQGAVVVGSVGVAGLVVYQREKAKKAVPATPATATPAASSAPVSTGTAGEIEDPTTGQYYPDTDVDPESGLTYQQEITEYGSVSAAEAASSGAGDQAALQGETPQEYVEQTGQYTGTTTGATVTTNAQWMAEVETGLSEQNYTASDIGQGLAAYFASKPLGTSSDGTNLYTMMELAVSEYGPPPTGSYPLLIGGTTTTGTSTKVTVPDVAGTDVEQAEGILRDAGAEDIRPGRGQGEGPRRHLHDPGRGDQGRQRIHGDPEVQDRVRAGTEAQGEVRRASWQV